MEIVNVCCSNECPFKIWGFCILDDKNRQVNTGDIFQSLKKLSEHIPNALHVINHNAIKVDLLSYSLLRNNENRYFFISITIKSVDYSSGSNVVIKTSFIVGNEKNPDMIGCCNFYFNMNKISKL